MRSARRDANAPSIHSLVVMYSSHIAPLHTVRILCLLKLKSYFKNKKMIKEKQISGKMGITGGLTWILLGENVGLHHWKIGIK